MIEPRARMYVPLAETEQAALRAQQVTVLAQLADRRAAERPLRLAMFDALAAQVPLRDVDAAADCSCGCHPRVDLGLHEGGTSCVCQLTSDERAERQRRAFESLMSLGASSYAEEDDQLAELAERAGELGVQARQVSAGAPFVVTGVVDGRGFFLSSRHGSWTVTVSRPEAPGEDPWTTDPTVVTYEIAEGGSDDLHADGRFSPARALEIAVGAVRTYLRRQACDHAGQDRSRFCSSCGTAMVDPALP